MISAKLTDAFRETSLGISIRYRYDKKLFKPRGLEAVTKVKDTVIRDLRFADDSTLNASNEQKMQLEMDGFSTVCNNFGLTISTKKAEVMYQSAPGNLYQEPDLTVKGKRLQAVENFIYLGSTRQHRQNGCRSHQPLC